MLRRGVNLQLGNLTERGSMEVTAIRQRLEHGFIYTAWVNSDRQMTDGLTKPQAAWKLREIMSAGKCRIVWDSTFQSARNLKRQNGQKAKEILMGDEFSMIILLYHFAF